MKKCSVCKNKFEGYSWYHCPQCGQHGFASIYPTAKGEGQCTGCANTMRVPEYQAFAKVGEETSGETRDKIKSFISNLLKQEREALRDAFFTYLYSNSIEDDLKGRFASEQYEKIWRKVIDLLEEKAEKTGI